MRKLLIIFLTFFVLISCKTKPPVLEEEEEPLIEIKEPGFEVISIYIIQADLVVTEFEAVIKIINPNYFSMELSSIAYELYGNGRFWADGKVKGILNIPADSTGETNFRFEMNFINMSRPLLDDVINMRRVNYRFKGNAEVKPDIPKIEAFNVDFDCTGYSEVKRMAEKK
ncbi:MAG: LEA type 2 family protein [Treponema sp.]|nr:LEA type 2 family protein [Treponema sp.]